MLLAAVWKKSLEPYDDRKIDAPAMIRDHLEIVFRGLAPESPAESRSERLS